MTEEHSPATVTVEAVCTGKVSQCPTSRSVKYSTSVSVMVLVSGYTGRLVNVLLVAEMGDILHL